MVVIRECSFFGGKYTPKYLGINNHHVCNLSSNGSKQIVCTYANVVYIIHTYRKQSEEKQREGKGRRGEKEKNEEMWLMFGESE